MYPVLGEVLGLPIGTHQAFVAAGLLVALGVFALERHRRGMDDPRLWSVVAVSLAWGGVFMYLGTWLQHLDLSRNAGLVEQFLHGNRSILGGLFGAYLGAHIGKRVTGYRARTGALFAPAVAAGMMVGRFGCLLTESPGTPTGTTWGVVLSPDTASGVGAVAGVPLHPSFAYEIAFHAIALVVILRWRERLDEPADLFTLYVAGYAIFRFLVEFVRGNEVAWLGLTRPQLVLVVLLPLLAWRTGVVLARSRASYVPQTGAP